MYDFDPNKISPGPLRIAWCDDDSSANMMILVDAEYPRPLTNEYSFADISDEERSHVVAIMFHQFFEVVGRWDIPGMNEFDDIRLAEANAAHIAKCWNSHQALVDGLKFVQFNAGSESDMTIEDLRNLLDILQKQASKTLVDLNLND
jgi:hypothetical protein